MVPQICLQKSSYAEQVKTGTRSQSLMCQGQILETAWDVMPVYYYNWPAQLKAVVDRFYSFTGELTRMRKKTILLTVAWDNSIDSFKVVQDYYDKIVDYMQFEDMGRVIGMGCGTPSMTQGTRYPQEAYELGKKI